MKPKVLIAVLPLMGVMACTAPESANVSDLEQRVAELEAWSEAAYAWSQEINAYLVQRAAQYQEIQNAIGALCEAAGVPTADCPLPPGDEENPPSGGPPKYPPGD
jgi:hypothetical protein